MSTPEPDSPTVPEWEVLGIPQDDEAEPVDAGDDGAEG